MADYPDAAAERAAARKRVRDGVMAKAEAEVRRLGRSIKCGLEDHAPDGCQNDGSNCLCQCHDGQRAA
jgi:hypothetical protein